MFLYDYFVILFRVIYYKKRDRRTFIDATTTSNRRLLFSFRFTLSNLPHNLNPPHTACIRLSLSAQATITFFSFFFSHFLWKEVLFSILILYSFLKTRRKKAPRNLWSHHPALRLILFTCSIHKKQRKRKRILILRLFLLLLISGHFFRRRASWLCQAHLRRGRDDLFIFLSRRAFTHDGVSPSPLLFSRPYVDGIG